MGDIAQCARHNVRAAKGHRRDMTALFPQIDKLTRLEVSQLTMMRGDNVLFEALSASVNSGDIFWIQGDNGIGKTTLLEALVGLSRPDDGAVSWFYDEHSSPANKLVAYQPHNSYAKPTLSAKEDLSFWAHIHDGMDLVNDALDIVGLTNRHNVLMQSFSAGQRRRMALAKLIVSQKPIWVMDEPGAAMDAGGLTLIDDLIRRHIARGGSAIIASHDSPRKLGANTRTLTLRAAA